MSAVAEDAAAIRVTTDIIMAFNLTHFNYISFRLVTSALYFIGRQIKLNQ